MRVSRSSDGSYSYKNGITIKRTAPRKWSVIQFGRVRAEYRTLWECKADVYRDYDPVQWRYLVRQHTGI